MNSYKLSAVIALTTVTFRANAQTITANELANTKTPSFNFSAVLSQLQTEIKWTSADKTIPYYEMDLRNMQALMPYAVRSGTHWKRSGKNNLKAEDHPVVMNDLLVPLLIGALKEQILRLDSLKTELRGRKIAETGSAKAGDEGSK
jgi:hypothetical protein